MSPGGGASCGEDNIRRNKRVARSLETMSFSDVAASHSTETKSLCPEPTTRSGMTIPRWQKGILRGEKRVSSSSVHQACLKDRPTCFTELKSLCRVALSRVIEAILRCRRAPSRSIETNSRFRWTRSRPRCIFQETQASLAPRVQSGLGCSRPSALGASEGPSRASYRRRAAGSIFGRKTARSPSSGR